MDNPTRGIYWNSYYSGRDVPSLPSQFAVFMLGEYKMQTVIDIGCGSGRDTFFFRSQGLNALGFDGSAAAIETCSRQATEMCLNRISFHEFDVANPSFVGAMKQSIQTYNTSGPVMLYARFFLHAINEAEEDALLSAAKAILSRFGGVLGLEYRTTRDRALTKTTPDHYRRFIDPAELIAKSGSLGFKIDYAIEGFGMAKYKADDAYVARTIFSV